MSFLGLEAGDLIDIACVPDDVYCPAEYHSTSQGNVYVGWVGWKGWENVVCEKPDEVIQRANGERVRLAKAWVMLSDKIPHWPCIVYIRTPFSESGADFLRSEKRAFIVLTGKKGYPIGPYYPHGVWFNTKHITPFRGSYQNERIRAGIDHSNPKLAENFKVAIDTIMSPQFRLHREPVVDHPFRWDGALDAGMKQSSAGVGAGAGGIRKRKREDKSDDVVDASSSSSGGRAKRSKDDVLAAPHRHRAEDRATVDACNLFDSRLRVPLDTVENSSSKLREARNALPNLLKYADIVEPEPFALARVTSVVYELPTPLPKQGSRLPSMRREKPRATKLAALCQPTAPEAHAQAQGQGQARGQAARKAGRPKKTAASS